MRWYITCIKNYAKFSGRASCKEFWFFLLFDLILICIAVALDNVFVNALAGGAFSFSYTNAGYVFWIYALFSCIPTLGVGVRRLHDTGRKGIWILVNLIPYLGTLIFLILAAGKSQLGENKYGSYSGV